MMQPSVDQERLGAVLDLVYDTAVSPTRWPDLLAGLAGLFNSHFADIFARTDDFSRYRGKAFGLDESDYQDQFLDTWVKRNAWSKRKPARMAGEVLSTREIVSPAELKREEMFADFLDPRGLHEGMRIVVAAGEGWVRHISLIRSWSAGPFEAPEQQLGATLLPHLRRALSLTTAASRFGAGGVVLDAVPQPMFLLDAAGRILRSNAAGEAMLQLGDGLRRVANQLQAGSSAQTGRLLAALAQAGQGADGLRRSASLRLSRGPGRSPFEVVLMPVREEAEWLSLVEPCVIAVVKDAITPAQDYAARFGLTTAETALAGDLLAGLRIKEVAERQGRSLNTVRTHLAALMRKAQAARQADLIRALLQA